MSSRRLAALAAAGAASLAGCGGDDGDPPAADRDPGPPVGGDVARTVPLHVRQHHRQHTGSTYVEGAVPFVRISRRGGKPAVEELVRDAPQTGRLLSTRVRPGRHVIASHVRPESGSGDLDPPVDRCRKPVRVQRAQSVTVTIVRVPGRSCGIRVVRVRFHDLVGKTVEQARTTVGERGFEMRVVKRDGEDLPVTQDLADNRVNVVVEDDEVTAVAGIY